MSLVDKKHHPAVSFSHPSTSQVSSGVTSLVKAKDKLVKKIPSVSDAVPTSIAGDVKNKSHLNVPKCAPPLASKQTTINFTIDRTLKGTGKTVRRSTHSRSTRGRKKPGAPAAFIPKGNENSVSHDEIKLMALDLKKLHEEKLVRVIHIIQAAEPSFCQSNPEIDLATLRTTTLRSLKACIRASCFKKKSQKKVASESKDHRPMVAGSSSHFSQPGCSSSVSSRSNISGSSYSECTYTRFLSSKKHKKGKKEAHQNFQNTAREITTAVESSVMTPVANLNMPTTVKSVQQNMIRKSPTLASVATGNYKPAAPVADPLSTVDKQLAAPSILPHHLLPPKLPLTSTSVKEENENFSASAKPKIPVSSFPHIASRSAIPSVNMPTATASIYCPFPVPCFVPAITDHLLKKNDKVTVSAQSHVCKPINDTFMNHTEQEEKNQSICKCAVERKTQKLLEMERRHAEVMVRKFDMNHQSELLAEFEKTVFGGQYYYHSSHH